MIESTAEGMLVCGHPLWFCQRQSRRATREVMNVPHGFADNNANELTSRKQVNTLTGMPIFSALPVTVVPA